MTECIHELDPATCTICLGKYTTAPDAPASDGEHQCAEPGCLASHKIDKFNAIRAHQTLGWFMQKNGDHWCPLHIPDWVDEWRERNG